MAYIIQTIENSEKLIDDFFMDRPELAKTFRILQEYIYSLDASTRLRMTPGTIIGISRIDSVFYFYVLPDKNGYSIKFKHLNKETFSDAPDKLEYYFECCRDVTDLVRQGKWKPVKLSTEPINKDASQQMLVLDSPAMPRREQLIAECDPLLADCVEYFTAHSDEPLNITLFGNRAYNALNRAGIMKYADLVGLKGRDLVKLPGFGNKSLADVIQACELILYIPEKQTTASEQERQPVTNGPYSWAPLQEKTERIFQNEDIALDNFRGSDKAAAFYQGLLELFNECVMNTDILSERDGSILISRLINGDNYQQIADRYGISRERVRQILNKKSRRFIYIFRNGKRLPMVYMEHFSKMVLDIPDEQFPYFLAYVKAKNNIIFDWLSAILIPKGEASLTEKIENLKTAEIMEESLTYDIKEKNIPSDFVNEDKDLLNFIELILQGIDPHTGEVCDSDSLICSEEMQRSMRIAQRSIIRNAERKSRLPEGAGSKWDEAEDAQLGEEVKNNLAINEIARIHKRTRGAIRARIRRKFPEAIQYLI